MEGHGHENKQCGNTHGHGALTFLVLITLAASIAGNYYVAMQTPQKTFDMILKNEQDKVGGADNYKKLNDLQKKQIEGYLKQAESQAGGAASDGSAAAAPAKPEKLSQDKIKSIVENAFFEGDKNADILVLEYSDPECPYCQKQYSNGVIEKLHAKYGDKIATAFKPVRGVNHANTESKSKTIICAGKISGAKAFVKTYKGMFDGSEYKESSNGQITAFTTMDMSKVPDVLKSAGVDMKKLDECMANGETSKLFETYGGEATELGVQGTPGSVIIKRETGEYVTIAGAYPYSEFESKINGLLK